MKSKISFILVGLLALSLFNCTGARVNLKADKLEYPVSMTNGIFNNNYEILRTDQDYEVIDEFSFSVSRIGLAMSQLNVGIFDLGATEDISNKINGIVKEKGGDGVVELQVKKNGLGTFFNIVTGTAVGIVFPLAALVYFTAKKDEDKNDALKLMGASFLVPGMINVFVQGKVVKFKR